MGIKMDRNIRKVYIDVLKYHMLVRHYSTNLGMIGENIPGFAAKTEPNFYLEGKV